MSNWQERIRQAFVARDSAEKQHMEAGLQREEDQKRQQIEEENRRQKGLQEARELLVKLGVRDLLERVRGVWGVGRIVEESDRISISLVLEWKYQGKYASSYYDQAGSIRWDPAVRGMWRDRFAFSASSVFQLE